MYPDERDCIKAGTRRRSVRGKRKVGGEVGNSADGSGKEDTRIFENGE